MVLASHPVPWKDAGTNLRSGSSPLAVAVPRSHLRGVKNGGAVRRSVGAAGAFRRREVVRWNGRWQAFRARPVACALHLALSEIKLVKHEITPEGCEKRFRRDQTITASALLFNVPKLHRYDKKLCDC